MACVNKETQIFHQLTGNVFVTHLRWWCVEQSTSDANYTEPTNISSRHGPLDVRNSWNAVVGLSKNKAGIVCRCGRTAAHVIVRRSRKLPTSPLSATHRPLTHGAWSTSLWSLLKPERTPCGGTPKHNFHPEAKDGQKRCVVRGPTTHEIKVHNKSITDRWGRDSKASATHESTRSRLTRMLRLRSTSSFLGKHESNLDLDRAEANTTITCLQRKSFKKQCKGSAQNVQKLQQLGEHEHPLRVLPAPRRNGRVHVPLEIGIEANGQQWRFQTQNCFLNKFPLKANEAEASDPLKSLFWRSVWDGGGVDR